MNDGKIIAQLRSGQPGSALQELYKAYPAIRHFVKTHGGNDDDAKDVFQESLIVLYRNVLKDEFQLTSTINTYLYSVCKYMWKDQLVKKNREVMISMADVPMEEIKSMVQEEERMKKMDSILAQLGEKCNAIFKLFYFQKQSMEQVADQLGYKSVDTAKTQKYKCLERARTLATGQRVTFNQEEL